MHAVINYNQGNYVDGYKNGHGIKTWPNGKKYEVIY